MGGFDTFDLSRVMGAAEQIKGMKREESRDALRDSYLQAQIAGTQQQQQFQQQEQSAKLDARAATSAYLEGQAIETAPDPIAAIKQLAPHRIQEYEAAHGAGSFGQLSADQVRQLAGHVKQRAAADAGIDITGGPELQARLQAQQQQGATEFERQKQLQASQFAQQQKLAGIQGQNELTQIQARGEQERQTAEIASPLKAARGTQQLRKEFRSLPSVKEYETVLPLIQSARKAPDTPQGDLQLIYTVGKILDPGSVVREGELQLTANAAPFLQQMIGRARKETGKGRLAPATRKDMLDMLQQRVQGYEQAYTRDYDQYAQYAQEAGADPSGVVGTRPETAFKPPGGNNIIRHPSGATIEILSE